MKDFDSGQFCIIFVIVVLLILLKIYICQSPKSAAVECKTDLDCNNNVDGRYCDTNEYSGTYTCVECLSDKECAFGETCTDNICSIKLLPPEPSLSNSSNMLCYADPVKPVYKLIWVVKFDGSPFNPDTWEGTGPYFGNNWGPDWGPDDYALSVASSGAWVCVKDMDSYEYGMYDIQLSTIFYDLDGKKYESNKAALTITVYSVPEGGYKASNILFQNKDSGEYTTTFLPDDTMIMSWDPPDTTNQEGPIPIFSYTWQIRSQSSNKTVYRCEVSVPSVTIIFDPTAPSYECHGDKPVINIIPGDHSAYITPNIVGYNLNFSTDGTSKCTIMSNSYRFTITI